MERFYHSHSLNHPPSAKCTHSCLCVCAHVCDVHSHAYEWIILIPLRLGRTLIMFNWLVVNFKHKCLSCFSVTNYSNIKERTHKTYVIYLKCADVHVWTMTDVLCFGKLTQMHLLAKMCMQQSPAIHLVWE